MGKKRKRKGCKTHTFYFQSYFLLESCYSSSSFGAVGRQRCWRWMRAHRAGELSASVGRRALMRRLCDAEGYNIREFKSSPWTRGKLLHKPLQAPPFNSPVSNLKIVGGSLAAAVPRFFLTGSWVKKKMRFSFYHSCGICPSREVSLNIYFYRMM